MSAHEEIYQKIVARLDRLRTKTKKLHLLSGITGFLIFFSTAIFILLAAEAILYFRPLAKLVVLGIAAAVVVVTSTWLVLRPLYSLFWRRQSPDDIDLALQVGNHFGSLRDRLADALQVFLKHRKNPEG